MHNAVNRGMRIRTMLNYMRGHYTLIYFHIHNICARVCTLMDKIFAYPQYVCVCGYNVNTARCIVLSYASSKVWVFRPTFLYFLMTSWRDMSLAKSN